jgi:hypothetical protein
VTFKCQRSKQHQGGPKQDPPSRLSGDFRIHKFEKKIFVVEREKRSILHDSVKCLLSIRSEVKLDTFVSSALFRFTKGIVLRNTIQ